MLKAMRTIRFRLWCLVGLFLIPQAFQINVILRRAQADISFSAKEQVGTAYLAALWPIRSGVDRALAENTPLPGAGTLADRLDAVGKTHQGALDLGRLDQDVLAMLRGGLATQAERQKLGETLSELITRVGDKSNLILDPDLDTYYLMSLGVDRLPELSMEASRGMQAIEMMKRGQLSEPLIAQLRFADVSFENAAKSVAQAVRLSIEGTSDTALKGRLEPLHADLADKSRRLSEAFRAVSQGLIEQAEPSGVLLDRAIVARGAFRPAIDAFQKIALDELDRLLEARIARHEASRNYDIGFVLGFIVLSLSIAIWLAATMMRSLYRLRGSLDALTAGDFAAPIAGLHRRDEIGGLARSVDRLRGAITTRMQESFSSEKADAVRDEQRRVIGGLAQDLDQAISGSVLSIDTLGGELAQSASFVSNSTNATRQAINASVAALDESVTGVRHATNSMTELAMAVGEIADQAQRAATASRTARQTAEVARSRSTELDRAVADIQASAKLVETIAAQTNLLALNATIEAARAGEAGRGFAVVASEVKQLAAQSARATAEIQERIGSIQNVTQSVVGAIDEMGQTIDRVDEASLSIASAVEQHNVTTAEITARVEDTANRAEGVARQINDVSLMADSTDEVAATLRSLAERLANEANTLRSESERFMRRIAA